MYALIGLILAASLTVLLVFNHVRISASEIFKHLPVSSTSTHLIAVQDSNPVLDRANHFGCTCPACQNLISQLQGKLPPAA
ncbi:hypothetical protein H6F43_04140 [Leptolyngbya sp. FACHB-36]|uniref:hypothetical protein n=1 Tax=Leptolyngbya sp. FACHB-36 TaxID=2692808 RepID=UPI0016817F1B|nr:hypothetical protein [Leptolyngbya sp. FACHB-36]MBD2019373.1 hypothetical protein [Leptolyngbya sp. FACHB-36]